MLLCFDGLMKSIRKTTSRHDTPGKLINDQYLVILDHIVLISCHQGMSTKSKINIVLQLQIIRICEVIHSKEALCLMDTLLGQVYVFVLLIDHVIACLLLILCHEDIHLGKLLAGTSGELLYKYITSLVKLCRLATLSGNDQRSTRLVDQYRIHLIDDRIVKLSLHQILLIDNHVITKIIESKLIVGSICDIAVICLPPLIIVHGI